MSPLKNPLADANFIKFATIEHLTQWLTSKQIPLDHWGAGSAKSICNLWTEIVAGESRLLADPPVRVLTAVQLLIYRRGQMLLEHKQVLTDGRERVRNFRPSEKVRPYEHYLDAARRCLKEELNVDPTTAQLDSSMYLRVESLTHSPSYPGLQTHYTFHVIHAKVPDLPDHEFWTDESNSACIKRHHWIWH